MLIGPLDNSVHNDQWWQNESQQLDVDKIIERMFADSQNQGPSPQRVESDRYVSPHYSQKILYLGKPWSDGHISLKKFEYFN